MLKVQQWVCVGLCVSSCMGCACLTPHGAHSVDVPPEGMVFVPGEPVVLGTDEHAQWDYGGAKQTYNDVAGVVYDPGRVFHKTGYGDEFRHLAVITPFYLDAHEVTNAQFEQFVKATGYVTTGEREATRHSGPWVPVPHGSKPLGWTWRTVYTPDRANHPVVLVSWFDAAAYARWAGKRLPTEEEWEAAARGTDGRTFPWGDTITPDYCNYWSSAVRGALRTPDGKTIPGILNGKITAPVGSYPKGRSPWGIDDMCGNVWEWTASWYASYPRDPHPFDYRGKLKVFRGGCFTEPPVYARSANRNAGRPDLYMINIGFRCAKDVRGPRRSD